MMGTFPQMGQGARTQDPHQGLRWTPGHGATVGLGSTEEQDGNLCASQAFAKTPGTPG